MARVPCPFTLGTASILYQERFFLAAHVVKCTTFLRHSGTVQSHQGSIYTIEPVCHSESMWLRGQGGSKWNIWERYDVLVGCLDGAIGPYPPEVKVDCLSSDAANLQGSASGKVTLSGLIPDCLSPYTQGYAVLPLNMTEVGGHPS